MAIHQLKGVLSSVPCNQYTFRQTRFSALNLGGMQDTIVNRLYATLCARARWFICNPWMRHTVCRIRHHFSKLHVWSLLSVWVFVGVYIQTHICMVCVKIEVEDKWCSHDSSDLGDTLIQWILYLIMKVNTFWGDITNTLARTKSLLRTAVKFFSLFVLISLMILWSYIYKYINIIFW